MIQIRGVESTQKNFKPMKSFDVYPLYKVARRAKDVYTTMR